MYQNLKPQFQASVCERYVQKMKILSRYIIFEMALTGNSTLRMKVMKMMSNYWIVFGVVSALTVCLVLEVSIVNVSGFSNPQNSANDIPIYSALSVLSIVAQLIILNFVYTRNVPFERSILRIMYMAIVLTQLAIIIILLIILIEINFILSYCHTILFIWNWYS